MDESDPKAEIDRLCAPDGPWLHLLDGAPADARQLGWLLAERGAVTRLLRGQCMRSRYALFDEVGAALQLPGEPAEDWSEFAAPLADLDWLKAPGGRVAEAQVLVVVASGLTLVAEPEEFAAFSQVLQRVAQRRTLEVEVGVPVPLHVVLADDAVGLAALRVRLAAAGVEFRDVVGWTPQEPSVVRDRGVRSGYVADLPGDPELDDAAVQALRERAEVLEVRRAHETFRGATTTDTPVYGAVVDRFDSVGTVTDLLAGAVAKAGGQVQVLSDIEPARSPRQQQFVANSVVLWPVPPQAVPAAAAVVEEPAPVGASTSGPDGVDETGAAFEIVAANLEWEFESGSADPDSVDAAVIAVAADDEQIDGVWRCWCYDPRRRRWVRVVLAVAVAAAAADGLRRTMVDTLESAGAARCCVEVVGAADVGGAHAWLKEQSIRLVGTDLPDGAEEAAADEADPLARSEPAGDVVPEQESELAAEPGAESKSEPAAEVGPGLDPETTFVAGPTEIDDVSGPLVEWAQADDRVIGLISAFSAEGEDRQLVFGVVIGEGEHSVADVQAAADEVTGDGPLVLAFAPSGRLDPLHLRLYRGGARLWRRKPARERSAAAAPAVEWEQIVDRKLDNGFVIMGIDSGNKLQQGSERADEIDSEVAVWAKNTEHVLAAMRCVSTDPKGGRPFVVYGIAIDALIDGEGIAESVAAIVGAHDLRRCGVQVFCPFHDLNMFDINVFQTSLQLWKTEEDLTPEQRGESTVDDEDAGEESAAEGNPGEESAADDDPGDENPGVDDLAADADGAQDIAPESPVGEPDPPAESSPDGEVGGG